jgi:HK97 family phage portal protein
VTRMIDRMLARADTPAGGYNEGMYSGAYFVPGAVGIDGKGQEGMAAGVLRHAREAFEQNGIVFGAIAARMALFSEARFQFQRMSDMGLYGDTTLAILEKPWPNATSGELLARLELDASYAGNGFIRRAEPDDDTPAQLVQMRPECVTILSEEVRDTVGRVFRRPLGYAEDMRPYGITGREPQIYAPDEVCHFSPLPDPKAMFRGMSWLTPILREVGADDALTTYKKSHLANGAMPGLVVKYSRKLSDPTVETLRKRIGARYGGPENAGKVIVLDEGADMTVAGSSLEQLQATALAAAGERRIASAAQVPLEVLGLLQGDYQAAVRRFADMWARPHWRMVCASLQHLVPDVPAQGVRLWFDVTGIAALREGELARGQTTLVKAQSVASFVTAGYTRESAIIAADSGDLSQLKPDPKAPPPGIVGRESATSRENVGPDGQVLPAAGPGGGGGPLNGRAPQAGRPQNLPGVGHPNLPNAKPGAVQTMPSIPIPARGPRAGRAEIAEGPA